MKNKKLYLSTLIFNLWIWLGIFLAILFGSIVSANASERTVIVDRLFSKMTERRVAVYEPEIMKYFFVAFSRDSGNAHNDFLLAPVPREFAPSTTRQCLGAFFG